MASTAHDLAGSDFVGTAEALAVAAFDLARRCAGGATMWCIAPGAPEHARHIAVEFVHPVVVGKPAIPAVSVDERDVVAALRTLVRAGDVVVAVGSVDDDEVASALRRCPAWGARSIWMGAGDAPTERLADHLLWARGDAGTARHDGSVVLLYHVLWELTHVCLEHPGLLVPSGDDGCDADGRCVTCADEGRLTEVISADVNRATVRTADGVELVDTSLIADVAVDDLLLVHAGIAIALVTAPAERWSALP
jgi:hypothetical protein